jgi:histidinol-phosphatase (PHP family)
MHDYHVHSTYSDGRFIFSMVRAAEQAGLDGVGFADHCNVSEREAMADAKYALGFNLDQTYERRRKALERIRERADVAVYDGVEVDYDPRDEAEIESFLAEAEFQYTVGSVHHLEDVNVHFSGYFEDKSDAELDALTEEYVDRLVRMVEEELFDIAAHVDLLERTEVFRGRLTTDHYERIADAFADSATVPEINAGRVTRSYGEFHPRPALVAALEERGVAFTVGTDSHQPEEIGERVPLVRERFAELQADPIDLGL